MSGRRHIYAPFAATVFGFCFWLPLHIFLLFCSFTTTIHRPPPQLTQTNTIQSQTTHNRHRRHKHHRTPNSNYYKHKKQQTQTHLHKHVVNLSHTQLTHAQISVLSKGLTFVPTPHPPKPSLELELQHYFRSLRIAYHFRSFTKQRTPHPFHLEPPQSMPLTRTVHHTHRNPHTHHQTQNQTKPLQRGTTGTTTTQTQP